MISAFAARGAAVLTVMLLAVVIVTGSQQREADGSPAVVVPMTATADAILADADAALVARDFVAAREGYALAIEADPDNIKARYGLAVTLSYLDRHAEAALAFRWVVDHGPRHREEVQLARRWLAPPDTAAPVASATATTATAPVDGENAAGSAVLQGRTEWKDTSAPVAQGTLQILVEGAEPATRGKRYSVRGRLNEPYRVAGIEPGQYRLLAQVGMTRLWDHKIKVEADTSTTLDLLEEASVAKSASAAGGS